ncbi:hypothetical protein [Pedobacter caeni]|uniref:Uncharacterized protein n=1 Tax=Pedobacter caeni TaxID=288992 RepID=A0A1M5H2Y2_9SPHI|nr:hypothetical protein [Pedobacter caeni]SHG10367.1 hypothetical protein SAMN04488522_104484 [Pedobacter caeni]
MAKSWYVYTGFGDPLLTTSYAKIKVKPVTSCGNQICAIYAEGENFRPDIPLSQNMTSYIKKALITGQLQPEIPDAKKYVYLRYREP